MGDNVKMIEKYTFIEEKTHREMSTDKSETIRILREKVDTLQALIRVLEMSSDVEIFDKLDETARSLYEQVRIQRISQIHEKLVFDR